MSARTLLIVIYIEASRDKDAFTKLRMSARTPSIVTVHMYMSTGT
jgi:hypothetical protein